MIGSEKLLKTFRVLTHLNWVFNGSQSINAYTYTCIDCCVISEKTNGSEYDALTNQVSADWKACFLTTYSFFTRYNIR